MTTIRTEPLTRDELREMYDFENNKAVYLAGPILHSDDGGVGWRERVETEYSSAFTWVNPIDFFEISEGDFTRLPESEIEGYEPEEGELVISDKAIVETDKNAIQLCDAVLVGYSDIVPSWGTPQEQMFTWEKAPELPVVVWHGSLDWLDTSPWLRYHASFRSGQLENCVRHLQATLQTLPLCLDCRESSKVQVEGRSFMVTDETCAWCGEAFGTFARPRSRFGSSP